MAAKRASFPSTVKVGGDITYSGRILEVAPDGTELLYGDSASLFCLRRGEKAFRKIDTHGRSIESGCALGGGQRVLALGGLEDDPPRIEWVDDEATLATYHLPADATLAGCIAARHAEALVAWGTPSLEDRRLQLWWWRLGAPEKPPVTLEVATEGMVSGAAFVGAQLFVSAQDRLFAATSSAITALDLAGPGKLSGARAGTHLLARVGRAFATLTSEGKVLHTLPPVLKLAQLTADGRRIVGYGASLDVKTPIEVRDRYPEWARTDFVAQFDAVTGEHLGWGKIADSVDALALLDDELIVTKSVKRIAFHPWKLLSES